MTESPAATQVTDIVSNEPGSFARTVFTERHPKLLDRLRASHPYTAGQRRRLDELEAESTKGTMAPLPRDAHDAGEWDVMGAGHFGRRWLDVAFLWAESYFYRRLLDALDYYRPGPWRGIDPFHCMKSAELAGLTVEPTDDRTSLLHASLWGNRADLGFRLTHDTGDSADHHLLVDDTERVWDLLAGRPPATVSVVADNAGRELTADLLLIDYLLHHRLAERVRVHLKPVPYYVSVADVVAGLQALDGASPKCRAVAQRLRDAAANGRLELTTHPFWCTPRTLHELPDDLAQGFAGSALTILKGDLNYRRLVGDLTWPTTVPFADAVAYFPGSVVALRALKSDVVVGLPPGAQDRHDATDPGWRIAGTNALIQLWE